MAEENINKNEKIRQQTDLLPAQATKENLAELKKEIEDFDAKVDEVKELDLEIEKKNGEKTNLLEEVQTRFEQYQKDLIGLDKNKLTEEEKGIVEEIRILLESLSYDLGIYINLF